MKRQQNIPLIILAGVLIVGAVTLACLGRVIPDFIVLCTTALVGAVAGVTLPAGAGSIADVADLAGKIAAPAPAPAPVPAAEPVVAPAPAPVTAPVVQPPSGMAR